MPYKNTKEQRAAWRKYYREGGGKKRSREGSIKRRERNREFLWKFLSEHPCEKCGEKDPVVLEFDHLNPKDKEANVANLISGGYSLKTVQKEMGKCRILCANCHRRVTWDQQRK